MKKQEILDQIAKLERQRFEVAMIDHWTFKDRELDGKLANQIRELEKRLGEIK